MFRIKSVFSNSETSILKIEGEIRDPELAVWTQAIKDARTTYNKQLIFDFSSVSFMSPKSIEVLQKLIENDMYILNCTALVKNMMQTSGLTKNVLD